MNQARIQGTSNCKSRRLMWARDRREEEMFIKKLIECKSMKKIGEGTYGAVFQTVAPTGKRIALKKIRLVHGKNGFPITAVREIKILKSLEHPNIVRLLDVLSVDEENGLPSIFLVFEYMEHDLAGLLASEFSIREHHVKHIIQSLLHALFYLHDECGLIHRDVKASNILVGAAGEVRLADFGLSRQYFARRKSYTPKVVTLWYRAPEILFGDAKYTPAVDVWAAGCVFSELIFNKPLFPGETELQQLTLICKLVGTPTEENYKGISGLKVKVQKAYPRTFHQRFRKLREMSPVTYDLLEGMLEIDPRKRITAAEALQHRYFSIDPLPLPPKPTTILPSHDFETRQRMGHYKGVYGIKHN